MNTHISRLVDVRYNRSCFRVRINIMDTNHVTERHVMTFHKSRNLECESLRFMVSLNKDKFLRVLIRNGSCHRIDDESNIAINYVVNHRCYRCHSNSRVNIDRRFINFYVARDSVIDTINNCDSRIRCCSPGIYDSPLNNALELDRECKRSCKARCGSTNKPGEGKDLIVGRK